MALTAFNGWAAQPSGSAFNAGQARGVAHYIMGVHAELQDDAKTAAEEYLQSIRDDGSSTVVRLRLAAAYVQLKRYSDAVAMARSAAQSDPEDLTAHYFLAVLHARMNDPGRSSAEYEHIFKTLAEREPSNSEFPKYLGQLYFSCGKESEAMAQFSAALKLDPKDTSLLYLLGSYYLEGPRRSEGLSLIAQCLDIAPDHADCLNTQAYALAEDNTRLDEALKQINTALTAEPDNAAYLDTRGWVYFRQGKYTEALRELKRADGILKDPVIRQHLAAVLLKLGDAAGAREYQQEQKADGHVHP
jgi:predicted Zn-dependent protease